MSTSIHNHFEARLASPAQRTPAMRRQPFLFSLLRRLLMTKAVCCVLLLGSCGSSSGATVDLARDKMPLRVTALTANASDADPASAGQPKFRLRNIESGAGELSCELWLNDAASNAAAAGTAARELYFQIDFDPARFSLVRMEAAGVFASADALQLCVLASPGHAEAGLVLPARNQAARTAQARARSDGEELIATLHLSRAAGAAPRAVSKAPTSAASAAPLSQDDASGELSWLYANQGDYNQDGQVSVSDLSPIGLHFGTAGPFDADSALTIVDGNGDGLISVGDLTAIGLNYGCRVEAYAVFQSDSESDYPPSAAAANGPGSQELAQLTLSQGSLPSGSRRSFGYLPANPSGYFWVRPMAGSESGTPSQLSNGAGLPSGARLQLVPASGIAPLVLRLHALDLPADKLPQQFEWDFEGDGTFDQTTLLPDSSRLMQAPAAYQPRVRVSFEDGSRTVLGQDFVLSSPKWALQKMPLDSPVSGFNGAALSSFKGGIIGSARPVLAVSFSNHDNSSLLTFLGSDGSGTAWEAPKLHGSFPVDKAPLGLCAARGGNQAHLSLIYQSASSADNYAQGLNMHGFSGSWTDQSSVASSSAPWLTATCGLAGKALVLMTAHTTTGSKLQLFERSSDSPTQFPQWNTPISLGSADSIVGLDLQASREGLGVVWLQHSGLLSYDLYFVHGSRNDLGQLELGLPVLVAQDLHCADIGPSLYFIDGFYPAIAFCDNSQLHYIRASDSAGLLWGQPQLVFEPLLPGSTPWQQLCLGQTNGLPLLAFANQQGDGEVRLVWGLDTQGMDWTAPEDVQIEGQCGAFTDMTVLDGQPLLCFWQQNPGSLITARRQAAD